MSVKINTKLNVEYYCCKNAIYLKHDNIYNNLNCFVASII